MHFGNFQFIWAYALTPFLIGLIVWLYLSRERALKKFAQSALIGRLLPRQIFDFRPLKAILFILAYLLLVFALMRPQFGMKLKEVEKQGVDIMIALDVSKSMLAEDITPNRIKRAKHEIAKLFDIAKGDRVGLIVFAGESYVQMPLTEDYSAAKMFLNAITTGWMSAQGTDLAGAIQKADTCLTMENADKVVILISDGEEQQGNAVNAAKEAAKNGVTIYTVGVGSEGGVPIPERIDGELVYKKDEKGEMVQTRLNTSLLEEIALASGGRYFHAGVDLNLKDIYSEIEAMEKGRFGVSKESRFHEQYQIFLLISLILFLLGYFTPERWIGKREWRGRFV